MVAAGFPTKCHNEGEDKPVAVIEAVRRAFHLSEEPGGLAAIS
jgi:hypothetical protein